MRTPPPMSTAPQVIALRKTVAASALAISFAWPTLAAAQTWINPGTGDWFTAGNWSSGAVPTAGNGVIVSNGGTATLTAPPNATPPLLGLFIGQAGSGTGVGTVIANGVEILAGGLSIGTHTGAGGIANGVLEINGAGGTASSITVASTFSGAAASNLTGRLDATGDFLVGSGGSLIVGEAFLSIRNTVTNGTVNIGGNAGTATFLVVGDVLSSTSGEVGSRSTGRVTIGGDLAMSTIGNIGVTFDPRVANPIVPGSFRTSEATGAVTVDRTFTIAAPNANLNVGVTLGGVVDGSLTVNTIDVSAANAVALSVGNALARGGVAVGSLSATAGDLRIRDGLSVGTTGLGDARGSVALGGQLLNTTAGGALSVGTISGGDNVVAHANGTVNAAGGISGFSSYSVGTINGVPGEGTTAQGTVIGGSAAPASNTGFLGVGSIFSTAGSGAGSATGTLSLGNSVNVTGGGSIAVGQAFLAALGSTATGALNIAGNAGTSVFFTVGDAFSGSSADVGSRGTGTATIGGNLAITTAASIGTAFNDRVADAGAPRGFRFNQASGDVTIGGTLSIADANVSLNVGATTGGLVDGVLRVGTMAMGANTLSFVTVGGAFGDGRASGTLEIKGGLLRTASLSVGTTSSGTASGTLRLTNADLQAGDVFAGTSGAGSAAAQMILSNAQMTVTNSLFMSDGFLSLERSRLSVGNQFLLGNGVLTHIEIDGLARGSQYGAIDTLSAFLDGTIEFDLGDLAFSGASAVFDILRSGSANGIDGDFDGFSFINMLAGYAATAGIELDGGIEVYRVRLTRSDVPEPASMLLMLSGIGLMTVVRRRARDAR